MAKFFNLGVNTPSLDLTYLLFRVPEQIAPWRSTTQFRQPSHGGGCVLTPNMTLRFHGPTDGLEIQTGELARGIVTLSGFDILQRRHRRS